jgi:hypothetical protein
MSSFLDRDDSFSKFLFLILIFVGFIIIINVSLSLFSVFINNNSPYLVKGLIPGNIAYVIQQDPTITSSIPVEKSDNKEGIEFTWSVWINITDVGTSSQYQHIFHKGEQSIDSDTGLNFPNNSPGLYIAPSTNELVVIMNTFKTINEEIKIPNFPMNKWANVIIRVMSNTLDVYINGTLAKRHILSSVPKQNNGNVYVASNGGFTGNLSNLRYFNYALQPGEILDLTNKGPNLSVSSKTTSTINSVPPYLALQWYTDNV